MELTHLQHRHHLDSVMRLPNILLKLTQQEITDYKVLLHGRSMRLVEISGKKAVKID